MNLANLYNYFICIQNNVPYNGVTKFEIPLSSKDPNLQNLSAIISFAVDKLSYIKKKKKFLIICPMAFPLPMRASVGNKLKSC